MEASGKMWEGTQQRFLESNLEVLCLCEELGGHLQRSHQDDCTFEKQDRRRG